MFFSFDGLDGVGKSTQIQLFCEWLTARGHTVVSCRDPGATQLGEAVREILLKQAGPAIGRMSEMLLYMAARAQLVEEIIQPALSVGKTIVSDRFLLSNIVYQGHAGGLEVAELWRIGNVITRGVQPNLTFLLDLPPAAAQGRLQRFGVGNPSARICFFGEAPGADEDRQGIPFVGRAGQLLTKMIEACKIKRDDVYILNVLKCRPPENRNPLPDEVVNCRGYFERQLEIIHPEMICCLGAVAAKTLLNTETPIGKLRGKFHKFNDATVVCTYHPAYLLRNPAAKPDTWEDLKMMMRKLGMEL